MNEERIRVPEVLDIVAIRGVDGESWEDALILSQDQDLPRRRMFRVVTSSGVQVVHELDIRADTDGSGLDVKVVAKWFYDDCHTMAGMLEFARDHHFDEEEWSEVSDTLLERYGEY